MINLNNVADLDETAGRVSELDLDRRQNERAAFDGAASVRKTETAQVTHEEMMSMPWRYPQGRIPETREPMMFGSRYRRDAEPDPWAGVRLPFPEMMLVIVIWALAFGASVSVLVWVLS